MQGLLRGDENGKGGLSLAQLVGLTIFGKDLHEGVNFNSLEDSVHRVGILVREGFRFFLGFSLDDDQAADLVGEGSGQNHASLRIERFHSLEVSRTVDLAPCSSFRSVEAKDDKFHRGWFIVQTRRVAKRGRSLSLERLAVAISAGNFMPPPNFALSKFPAQIDDSSIQQVRKVAEPHIDILDEHAHFLDNLEVLADLLQCSDIGGTGEASPAELSF